MRLLRQLRHPRPDIGRRVVPDRSGREIVDLVAHYGHELRANVYFHDARQVLAAALTGTPGNLYAELRPPQVEAELVDDERLGAIALHALLSFDSTGVPSMRDYKPTDWSTYQASGAPSVKAFNRTTIAVSLETMHGTIRIEAASLLPGDSVFAVRALAPVSVVHSEMGQLLRRVVRGAQALRDAGVM
jgi:hypothetical protein